jgi:GntR family transcriptional regulator of arabinose operon
MKNSVSTQVANSIIAEFIENDRIAPGEQLPTVRELELRYATSRATIAHALGSLEDQGRVYRRHGVGCFVSVRDQKIESANSTGLIGFVAASSAAELTMRTLRGIERTSKLNGLSVVVANSWSEDPFEKHYETEQQHVERLQQAGCIGVVLNPVMRSREQLKVDYLSTRFRDFPIVLVDMALPEQMRPYVAFDNYSLASEMTERLIQDGHREIAFMDYHMKQRNLQIVSVQERFQGFLDVLKYSGITFNPENRWVVHSEPVAMSYDDDLWQMLLKWKDRHPRPTAVFALEDGFAMRLIQVAQDLGIDVPNDLLVLGFDNSSVGRSFRPSFPTTDPNFEWAGEIASRLVLRLSRSVAISSSYMLPVPVLWRDGDRSEASAPHGKKQLIRRSASSAKKREPVQTA